VFRGTSTITPTVYNEAAFTWSEGKITSDPVGLANRDVATNVERLMQLPYENTLNRVPSVTAGFSSITGYGPYRNQSNNYNILDNVSMLRGRHNFKFGGTWNRYHKTENAAGAVTGSFTFAGATRDPGAQVFQQAWANFLLGRVATFSQSSADLAPNLRMNGLEFYAQDDWRVTDRFTLNIGLRWSDFFQPYDKAGLLSNFSTAAYNQSQAPRIDPLTGNLVPNTGNRINGMIYNEANVPAGGTPSPFGDKVGNEDHQNWAPRIGFAWDVFGTGRTSVRAGYGMFYDTQLVGTYVQNVFANPPFNLSSTFTGGTFENPTAGTPVVSAAPLTVRGTPLPYKTPYSQQWSFDIQQQIAQDFVATIGYVGSKGTNLLGIVDLNLLPPGFAQSAGLLPAGATTARVNAIRPYAGYTAINAIMPAFDSNYHSLQASANKRFSGGSLIQVAYTWSKALTNNQSDRSNAPQNSYDFDAEWGPAALDRTHVLNGSFVYELPFLRTQQGFAGRVLGGWQVSGIFSMMTGAPLTISSGTSRDPGGVGFLGASAAGPRPDVIADPETGTGLRSLDNWFVKTGTFAEPPTGRVGNAGRGIIRGPGVNRWDIALLKNIRINERLRFQLRGESFNTFNHTQWLGVGTAWPGAGNEANHPTFGRVTSARDPRTMQLGLKLYW
jgi:hypothetical protein